MKNTLKNLLARIFHTCLKRLTESKVGRRSCGAGVPSIKRLGRRRQPLEKRFIVPRNLASQEAKRLFHFGWEERKGQQRILGSLPEPPEGGTPNCSRSEFRLQAVPLRAFFRPAIRRFLGSLALPKFEICGLGALLLLLPLPARAQPPVLIHQIFIQHVGPPAVSDAFIRANIRSKEGDRLFSRHH